eukprot:6187150-Karenia_brevis.AAC.1
MMMRRPLLLMYQRVRPRFLFHVPGSNHGLLIHASLGTCGWQTHPWPVGAPRPKALRRWPAGAVQETAQPSSLPVPPLTLFAGAGGEWRRAQGPSGAINNRATQSKDEGLQFSSPRITTLKAPFFTTPANEG